MRLQIAPGLLRREEGLGRLIHQKLVAKLFPMESSPEETAITPMNLVSIAQRCDRVIVLTDRRPGPAAGQPASRHQGRIRLALRQRRRQGRGPGRATRLRRGRHLNFDPETNDALATHLVREMASC